MATNRNLNEQLVEDTGLTVHQGSFDKAGPNVGVNQPSPTTGRFEVFEPHVRTIQRTHPDLSTRRRGTYGSGSNKTAPNYDIWYAGSATDTNYTAVSQQTEDQFYCNFEPYDDTEGTNNITQYWDSDDSRYASLSTTINGYGMPRYYREGSRVWLDGMVRSARQASNGSVTRGYPIEAYDQFKLQHRVDNKVGTTALFKVPPEYAPDREHILTTTAYVWKGTSTAVQRRSSTGSIVGILDYGYCQARINVRTDGLVFLSQLYPYSNNPGGSTSSDGSLPVSRYGTVANGFYAIDWMTLSNLSWPVFQGPRENWNNNR